MFNFKFDVLKKPLELKKTHDFCATNEPALIAVFIHGIASDSSAFRNTLRYLEGSQTMQKVRFVTFDLLGSGKSYKSDSLNYNYVEQIEALGNSLEKLDIKTPLVLVGHSMGTMIATRYASTHKRQVSRLILCSPPIYTEADLDNPAMDVAMEAFRKAVSVKNRKILKEKAFNGSIDNIVKNRNNYQTLAKITVPTALIYGDADPFIAAFNLPKIVKDNPEYLKKIKTLGRHGMSREKYVKVREILEEAING